MKTDISSSENQWVKLAVSLHLKKYRDDLGMFLIEGVRLVSEALDSDFEIEYILTCEDLLLKTNGGREILQRIESYKVYNLPAGIFNKIADTQTPQGIMAVVRKPDADGKVPSGSFFVILDDVRDPGNVGTIIRTADAAGADAVLLSRSCCDLYSLKTIRATMGSIFRVRVYDELDLVVALQSLKDEGIRVIISDSDAQKSYFELDYKKGTALVVGNEASGVSPEVMQYADERVRIPMKGNIESLNAGMAAGILMYEVVRQRLKG